LLLPPQRPTNPLSRSLRDVYFDTCLIIEKIAVWRLRSPSASVCSFARCFCERELLLASCILILLFARAQQKRRRIETRRLIRACTLNERGRKRETSLACEMREFARAACSLSACTCVGCDFATRALIKWEMEMSNQYRDK